MNLSYQQLCELEMMSEEVLRSLSRKFSSLQGLCDMTVEDAKVKDMHNILLSKLSGDGRVF